MIDYKKICLQTVDAVHETGEFIMKEFAGFDISMTEVKGLHDLVSYVDKGSEEMLVERLGKILPESGFIAEEGTSTRKGNRFMWIIDPLDGTTNFVHGVRMFAISVALTENGKPVAGVVYDICGKETFTSWLNGGTWLNGKTVHVSAAEKLSSSLIATGFPYSDFSRLDNYMRCFTHFCRATHGIRRFGSAAVDLAYVACGRFDAFFEYGLNPWDVTAGALLVREAGGHFCNFRGDEKDLSGKEIIASNNRIFREFLENVSKFMLD
jgi:myo-inositol-1(or 4)-monophosphatase